MTKMNNQRSVSDPRCRRGGALIYGIIIIGMVSVVFAGLVQYVVSSARASFHAVRMEQALHIAEAGVYFYRWHLAHNVEGRTATQVQQFWNGDPIAADDDGDGDCDDLDTVDPDGNGIESYVAPYTDGITTIGEYEICVTPPSAYSTIVMITVTGRVTGGSRPVERTVQARLRKPSWSEKAILADGRMRLSDTTVIHGPLHSNNGFRFDGIAHNIITSSLQTYYDSDSDVRNNRPGVWGYGREGIECGDEPNAVERDRFRAGKLCPVERQDFDNVVADFNMMRDTAQTVAGSLYFPPISDPGYYVELGVPSSGQMRVRRVDQMNTTTYEVMQFGATVGTYTLPSEGVIYFEDDVWVLGTVPAGAQITIAAHSPNAAVEPNIFVGDDDILYEDYDSNTVLGLAAEDSIHIMRYIKGNRSAYNGDALRIDAAILAQGGNFGWTVPPGTSGGNWWSNQINQITINGAIASKERFGFGYTSGAGFVNRNIIFNNNLLFYPPPLFPVEASYEIDLWEEIG